MDPDTIFWACIHITGAAIAVLGLSELQSRTREAICLALTYIGLVGICTTFGLAVITQ